MPVINFDIKGIELFTDLFPNRIKWVMSEVMKMTGGHERKLLRKFIESGGPGWPGLSSVTRKMHPASSSPLFNLGKLARWKYTGGANPRATIGFFFNSQSRGSRRISEKRRYYEYFGKGADSIFLKHEEGLSVPVTPQVQRFFAARGIFLRKGTILKVPARPMIGPFWEREKELVPAYVQKRFWEKMAVAEGKKM